jgi:mutator protein MutT
MVCPMTLAGDFKRLTVAIALIIDGSRILIARRKKNDSFGGFWEFPGGKCEEGESTSDCVRREIREELGIDVTPLRELPPIEYEYPKTLVTLIPFICRHDSGEPAALSASEVRWVEVASLGDYRFPPANAGLIAMLSRGGIDLTAAKA